MFNHRTVKLEEKKLQLCCSGSEHKALNLCLKVIGFTLVMTWLFNNTRGSIFLALLFHSAVDTAPTLLFLLYPETIKNLGTASLSKIPAPAILVVLLAQAVVWLVIAGIILLVTRGRLSYKPALENDVQPAPYRSVIASDPGPIDDTAVAR